ncbi:hypothetical protein HMPREF1860_00588 [Prevotella amnii]|uniref:Uncharacterized protein n=1 Tax=Prevotella amnii TaxID=419005 RepID=A0A134BI43_9BACT|nr:hypothetical protein HMPREF1860_00588 [Prevotella amnii]
MFLKEVISMAQVIFHFIFIYRFVTDCVIIVGVILILCRNKKM